MNKFETPELKINQFERENIVTASSVGLDLNENGTLSVQGDATKFNLDSYND